MLFVKIIALALLASTASAIPLAMPAPEPSPQNIPYTSEYLLELKAWFDTTCNNLQNYNMKLVADFEEITNFFVGDFQQQMQHVENYFAENMLPALNACRQYSAMMEVASQTFDSENGINCGNFCG